MIAVGLTYYKIINVSYIFSSKYIIQDKKNIRYLYLFTF